MRRGPASDRGTHDCPQAVEPVGRDESRGNELPQRRVALVVVEAAYNTGRTWLTAQAAQKGCKIIDGLSIYVEQTALALKAWTGKMPDTAAMREAAEEFLGI